VQECRNRGADAVLAFFTEINHKFNNYFIRLYKLPAILSTATEKTVLLYKYCWKSGIQYNYHKYNLKIVYCIKCVVFVDRNVFLLVILTNIKMQIIIELQEYIADSVLF